MEIVWLSAIFTENPFIVALITGVFSTGCPACPDHPEVCADAAAWPIDGIFFRIFRKDC